MGNSVLSGVPFLVNSNGVIVGYIDKNNVERTLAGIPLTPEALVNGGIGIIAQSAVASSVTGTVNETTLATITIPAGAMGVNGVLRVSAQWSFTNNSDTKTINAYFGGVKFLGANQTTRASVHVLKCIRNRNSQSVQALESIAMLGPGTADASTTGSAAINTAVQQTITFTGQLGTSTDTITLEGYTIEVLNP